MTDFNYYDFETYADLVAYLLENRKTTEGKIINKKELSEKVRIQASQLSRFLKHENHFSSDHHYLLKSIYKLNSLESEFINVLFEYSKTSLEQRKTNLKKRIIELKAQGKDFKNSLSTGVSLENHLSNEQILYYHQPLHMVIHMFLISKKHTVKSINELSSKLGISKTKIFEVLARLKKLNYINYDDSKTSEIKVISKAVHLEKDSPFQSSFQMSMKNFSQSYLLQFPEKAKQNFAVTFTLSENNIQKAESLILNCIKELQGLAIHSTPDHVAQFNLDFFTY